MAVKGYRAVEGAEVGHEGHRETFGLEIDVKEKP